MKKKYSIVILLIISCLFIGTMVSAGLDDAFDEQNLDAVAISSGYDITSATTSTLEGVVGSIIRLILSLLGLIFILLIFLAADLWMKANGNPEKVLKAKKMISQALIGLSFVLIAYALSYVLAQIFGGLTLT